MKTHNTSADMDTQSVEIIDIYPLSLPPYFHSIPFPLPLLPFPPNIPLPRIPTPKYPHPSQSPPYSKMLFFHNKPTHTQDKKAKTGIWRAIP